MSVPALHPSAYSYHSDLHYLHTNHSSCLGQPSPGHSNGVTAYAQSFQSPEISAAALQPVQDTMHLAPTTFPASLHTIVSSPQQQPSQGLYYPTLQSPFVSSQQYCCYGTPTCYSFASDHAVSTHHHRRRHQPLHQQNFYDPDIAAPAHYQCEHLTWNIQDSQNRQAHTLQNLDPRPHKHTDAQESPGRLMPRLPRAPRASARLMHKKFPNEGPSFQQMAYTQQANRTIYVTDVSSKVRNTVVSAVIGRLTCSMFRRSDSPCHVLCYLHEMGTGCSQWLDVGNATLSLPQITFSLLQGDRN